MERSIQETTRFVIGVAMLRSLAIQYSENQGISFNEVAKDVLRADHNGENLRAAVSKLVEREPKWLRKTPSHSFKTDTIMQSRAAELHAFRTTHAAVIATHELTHEAQNDGQANQRLLRVYADAFSGLDKISGSTQEKRSLKELMSEQVLAASDNHAFTTEMLDSAQSLYLNEYYDSLFADYTQAAEATSEDNSYEP